MIAERFRKRLPRWLTLTNVIVGAVFVWSLPRCVPHVAAIVGIKLRDYSRPAYEVTTRTGGVVTHDSLRGRVVLVNIWATWCLPCRAEMPALQQLADAFARDSVVVLGLSVDRGDPRTVDAFLSERGITYPVAIVGDGVVGAFGGVRGYPTSVLIDKQGVVRHTVIGPIAPVTLRPAIWRLVRE